MIPLSMARQVHQEPHSPGKILAPPPDAGRGSGLRDEAGPSGTKLVEIR